VFQNKKYITFDCYGTLIDWDSGIRNSLRQLSDSKGLNLDIDELVKLYYKTELEVEHETYRSYKEVLTLTVKRILESEGIEGTEEDYQILVRTIPNWQPFPEVPETLTKLKEKGYKLIILSNIDDDIIAKSIQNIGVEFDGIVTAQQIKSYKPTHGHWEEMLRRFSATKDEVLHVAASYIHDIIPAKEQGFNCIWINRNHEEPSREIRPEEEFDNLSPVLETLPDKSV